MGIIPDKPPDGDTDGKAQHGREQHQGPPAVVIHELSEGIAGEYGPEVAEQKGHARYHGEIAWRKPAAGQFQQPHEGHGHGTADEQPPDTHPEHDRREREEDGADGGDPGTGAEQPARPPRIGDDARRDLHGHIAVEVVGGELSERAGTDPELTHELFGHDRRRHPVEKAQEIEKRPQAPDEPGDAHRWWLVGRGHVDAGSFSGWIELPWRPNYKDAARGCQPKGGGRDVITLQATGRPLDREQRDVYPHSIFSA